VLAIFLALRRSFYAVKISYRSLSPPVFQFLVYTSLFFAMSLVVKSFVTSVNTGGHSVMFISTV